MNTWSLLKFIWCFLSVKKLSLNLIWLPFKLKLIRVEPSTDKLIFYNYFIIFIFIEIVEWKYVFKIFIDKLCSWTELLMIEQESWIQISLIWWPRAWVWVLFGIQARAFFYYYIIIIISLLFNIYIHI